MVRFLPDLSAHCRQTCRDVQVGGFAYGLAPTRDRGVNRPRGLLMLWSSVTIPGKPAILFVDASVNLEGWESEFCDRLCSGMVRRGLQILGGAPIRVGCPEDLDPKLEPGSGFNCILLFAHGQGAHVVQSMSLGSYWKWLNSHGQVPPLLFAACTWESYDPVVSQEILESRSSFAPLAIAPRTKVTPREANLFFMKFFTELDLHSDDTITGRMAWFSWSKAKELLRRRRLTGTFGVRC